MSTTRNLVYIPSFSTKKRGGGFPYWLNFFYMKPPRKVASKNKKAEETLACIFKKERNTEVEEEMTLGSCV